MSDLSARHLFASQSAMPGISATLVLLAGDPYVALLDPLNEGLRIEFSESRRNFEQLRGLRLVANVLGGDGGAVLHYDPQREFARGIDPAE